MKSIYFVFLVLSILSVQITSLKLKKKIKKLKKSSIEPNYCNEDKDECEKVKKVLDDFASSHGVNDVTFECSQNDETPTKYCVYEFSVTKNEVTNNGFDKNYENSKILDYNKNLDNGQNYNYNQNLDNGNYDNYDNNSYYNNYNNGQNYGYGYNYNNGYN